MIMLLRNDKPSLQTTQDLLSMSVNYKQAINALKTVGKRYDLYFLAILLCAGFLCV